MALAILKKAVILGPAFIHLNQSALKRLFIIFVLCSLFLSVLSQTSPKQMGFEEYEPKSTLVVPQHSITHAKYPFFDVHNHQWDVPGQDLKELFAQMDANPEIRQILQNNIQLARTGLAALFLDEEETAISKRTAQTVGTFHHVLLSGMIAQWLIDPKHALSAQDLTSCMLSIAAGLQEQKKPGRQKRPLRKLSRKSG